MEQQAFVDLTNMSITFTASNSQNTIKNLNIELRLQNEALGADRSYSRRSLLIEMSLETSSKFGTGFTHHQPYYDCNKSAFGMSSGF